MNRADPGAERGAAGDCPRCGREVTAERFEGVDGVTWLRRCPCGWSGAVAESGVLSRQRARGAIERARRQGGTEG